jgi:2-keto-4-pentenoate hydratase/2-oxohepta-3-ene-1,7-dioic acid hydratase in catechol pathway
MTNFVRFRQGTTHAQWGVLDQGRVFPLESGLPYGPHKLARKGLDPRKVKLVAPVDPPKIFAVGLNYRSHLNGRPAPATPEIFYKPITAVIGPGEPIVIPKSASNVHYEGELVLVIGRTVRRASKLQAARAIFGVTCGNDVSERGWQHGAEGAAKDLQWWRAKGADTFAPCGPVLVAGIDFSNLRLTTRLNGEAVQEQSTSDLLFNPADIVATISQEVTLQPGDLVFTGTPGTTRKMKPGDVVEVEIEGIGVLRNRVRAG